VTTLATDRLVLRPFGVGDAEAHARLYGDPEVTLSIQAQLAALAHGIAPGLVQRVLGWVARALPSVGGIGPGRVRGAHDADVLAGSTLRARIERATERNNER